MLHTFIYISFGLSEMLSPKFGLIDLLSPNKKKMTSLLGLVFRLSPKFRLNLKTKPKSEVT